MLNIGIDMVEIDRIRKILKRNKNFLGFILGEIEFKQLEKRNFPCSSVAANFCGKEAFVKSIGCGIFSFNMKHIQIIRNELSQPEILLGSEVSKIIGSNLSFSISITHTKTTALAVVVSS
ncbi:MAG: holo-ACP synthase [Candidatus Improbicoccus pseudotrichonymphae]|uniref:Holo-ACP synthase n=1 Tax=Candidatus Improbicoccus pseudotrichonymphae TaxID=3033792 RepID=A0AA48HXP7_9FIRM|nr:MAG: holo-ACP synthase [Candidatus Improbicoccus pseudotrichonymphae]